MSRALRLAKILRIIGRYRLDEFIDREQLPALPRFALGCRPGACTDHPTCRGESACAAPWRSWARYLSSLDKCYRPGATCCPKILQTNWPNCRTMSRRFPNSNPSPLSKQALGKPVTELFASFESTPMASASVAQVHCATLHSGEQVVVKVVRPDIEPVIRQDIALMFTLAKTGGQIPPPGQAPAPGGGGIRLRTGHPR